MKSFNSHFLFLLLLFYFEYFSLFFACVSKFYKILKHKKEEGGREGGGRRGEGEGERPSCLHSVDEVKRHVDPSGDWEDETSPPRDWLSECRREIWDQKVREYICTQSSRSDLLLLLLLLLMMMLLIILLFIVISNIMKVEKKQKTNVNWTVVSKVLFFITNKSEFQILMFSHYFLFSLLAFFISIICCSSLSSSFEPRK